MLAFIPARSGSLRVPNKNIMMINGHPLLAYAISGAINSGLFDHVVVCTDSEDYASVARKYGAFVPEIRPSDISHSTSPDREWVDWILNQKEFLPLSLTHI